MASFLQKEMPAHWEKRLYKERFASHCILMSSKVPPPSPGKRGKSSAHTNAKTKVFKIMAHPYCNRRRRHLLKMSLICGIIHCEAA